MEQTNNQGEFDFQATLTAGEYDDREFSDIILTGIDLSGKQFNHCSFTDCNFSDANLSGAQFDSCSFIACNMSNPGIDNTRFIDLEFSLCKITGFNLYRCSQSVFDLRFIECRLTSCNFTDIQMKLCAFRECEIKECCFQNTFLVEVDFFGSSFSRTLFHNCDLRKASFRDAHGYSIDPRNNNVQKAAFSVPDVLALLDVFEIVIKSE